MSSFENKSRLAIERAFQFTDVTLSPEERWKKAVKIVLKMLVPSTTTEVIEHPLDWAHCVRDEIFRLESVGLSRKAAVNEMEFRLESICYQGKKKKYEKLMKYNHNLRKKMKFSKKRAWEDLQ